MEYITDDNILSDGQFGFRKNNSTTYLMLELFDKIYSAKERGKRPGILFLDIKKSLDSVDHDILLKKLKRYGIKCTAQLQKAENLLGTWNRMFILLKNQYSILAAEKMQNIVYISHLVSYAQRNEI